MADLYIDYTATSHTNNYKTLVNNYTKQIKNFLLGNKETIAPAPLLTLPAPMMPMLPAPAPDIEVDLSAELTVEEAQYTAEDR